jgi:tetratricopeptide (TPR) repeat protein
LSLETIAKWLTGDLLFEDLTLWVIPHFFACCPVCEARFKEVQRLKKDIDHWDERVAVFEGPRAPELLEVLMQKPFEEQIALLEDDPEYQTWGFCQILLKTSRETAFDDPPTAVNFAELAVTVAQGLGAAYDPCWVADLQARSYACLGNARRILGELRSAETAFREAQSRLRNSTGNPLVEAEILGMKSSLRRAQRRFPDALNLITEAATLYRENGDAHGSALSRLKQAKVLEESGELDAALSLLREVVADVDGAVEPQLSLYARFNLTACLVLAGRFEAAAELLPELREACEELAKPLDRIRLRWLDGKIAFGLGRTAEAETVLRDIQLEFLSRGMGFDTGLVSLDLAILYIQEGRTAELKRLAVEILPIFEARDVHREAMATLVVFQRACEQERLTIQLATQLAAALRRDQPSPA